MSGFANPIIGGGGSLVYPSIHSPNYVAATSGWTINKDGSVEFNNGTFRGSVVGGSLFVYNGTPGVGTLVESSTALTVDPFGNKTIPGGDAVYSNTTALLFSSAGIQGYTGSLAAGWTPKTGATFQLDIVTHAGLAGFDFLGYVNATAGLILAEIGTLAAVAGGPFLYGSTASGMLRFISDTTKGDSNNYDTARLTAYANAVPQVISSTSSATLAGLSVPLAVGIYRMRAWLVCTAGANAGQIDVRPNGIGGLVAGAGTDFSSVTSGGTAVPFVSHQTALNADLLSQAMISGDIYVMDIRGKIVVTTAGTFILQGRESINGDPWTLTDGEMNLYPVG